MKRLLLLSLLIGLNPAWASVVTNGTVGADTSLMSWTMWYKLTQQ